MTHILCVFLAGLVVIGIVTCKGDPTIATIFGFITYVVATINIDKISKKLSNGQILQAITLQVSGEHL
jgi:hypothetical protein